MKKEQTRHKVISNRLFSKLWIAAGKINNKNQYIQNFTSVMSKDYIDFYRKYGIKYEEAIDLLKEIYEKNRLTFREILELTGKRKADISNTFCIPIRTVEEWYSGNNPCTSYIRLMILRHYKLLRLGKYIFVEIEEEYKHTPIHIYKKHTPTITDVSVHKKNSRSVKEEIIEEEDEFEEIDYFLASIREKRKEREETNKINTENTSIQELLARTDFIGDILSKRK